MDTSVQFLMSFLTYNTTWRDRAVCCGAVIEMWVVTREVEVCVLSRARGVCGVMR